jgi:hypothetical protein
MTSARAVLAVALLAAACAAPLPSPEAFTFAVGGDTPYSDAEEREWLAMIERINREDVAFTIHVGDFKGGGDCSDELYARRRAQFDSFARPLVYTPGDNEWTDCRRPYMGSMYPLERLSRLREVFFGAPRSLGRTAMATEVQTQCTAPPPQGCGCAYPENRAWTHGNVAFVTLNVPGSENNVGYDAANDAEAKCRDAANAQWLDRAVAAAEAPGVRALVIAAQANPWIAKKPVYAPFVAQVERTYGRLRKPVLFIHGDTHTYRADWPFAAPVARLETYGSPFVGWVKVTIDPARPGLFSYEPKLQRFVPPH